MNLEELPKLLHDAIILEIRHSIDATKVSFVLSDMRKLVFHGVIVFRSESYFLKTTLSSKELYISCCEIKRETWLLGEALNRYRPNGRKKWGDHDLEHFNFRKGPFLHINMYCIDWEFDVVCESVELEPTSAKKPAEEGSD